MARLRPCGTRLRCALRPRTRASRRSVVPCALAQLCGDRYREFGATLRTLQLRRRVHRRVNCSGPQCNEPFFGAVVAALWLKDALTLPKLAGMGLGLAGVVVLVGWQAE